MELDSILSEIYGSIAIIAVFCGLGLVVINIFRDKVTFGTYIRLSISLGASLIASVLYLVIAPIVEARDERELQNERNRAAQRASELVDDILKDMKPSKEKIEP